MSLTPLVVSDLKPQLNATLVKDGEGLEKLVHFMDRVSEFCLDLETNVTKSFIDRKIRTISIGNKEEQYVVDLLKFAGSKDALMEQGNKQTPSWAVPIVEAIKPRLDSDSHLKIGVNLEFEYIALYWCLGVQPWNFYDCLLAEKLIHAGEVHFKAKGFWAMDDMLARYARLQINKDLQTSFDLESELTQDQIDYAALDVRLPLAIKGCQEKILKKDGLEMAAYIENSAIPAFADMHINGLLISEEKWMKVVEENQAKHKQNLKVLDSFFLPVVGSKHRGPTDLASLEAKWRLEKDRTLRAQYRTEFQTANREQREHLKALDSYEGEAAINYGSTAQLLAALRKMGFGVKILPNTNDRSLEKLSDKPVIKALQAFRTTLKVLTTYGEDFLKKRWKETGRIHSRIDQYGADTGRTTSTSPNVQNIHKDFRSCFVSRPGYKYLTIDYNGCELRIIAEYSGEKSWIDAFNRGWDVHSVGAEILFGDDWKNSATPECAYYHKGDHQKCQGKNPKKPFYCPVHAKLRDLVKAMNFGIAYGMEAQKLAEQLGITKAEAEKLLALYKAKNKGVMIYLDGSGKNAKFTMEARTLSGRRRKFKKPDWAAIRTALIEEAIEEGKDPSKSVTSDAVRKKYHGQFGSIEREGKNTPIQGSNADIAKLALGCGKDANGQQFLWHKLRKYDAFLVNFVHDENCLEAVDDQCEEVMAVTGDCMGRAGAVFVKSVEMTYEGHIADCWVKG